MRTVAIIGAGSAGLTAARMARASGARVILPAGPDPDRGSLCVDAGCMPSKALFYPIDLLHHARKQRNVRIQPVAPDDYLAGLVAWKDRQIAQFRAYRRQALHELAQDKHVTLLPDYAAFVDPNTLQVGRDRHPFDAVVIATGSSPVIPRIDGLDSVRVRLWTSREILGNRRVPESLAVVGGGAVGLEFALRYARLGAHVTLMSNTRLLHRFPAAFGQRLQSIYEHEQIEVLAEAPVVSFAPTPEGLIELQAAAADTTHAIAAECVLLAVGRRPNLSGLNLAAAGISTENGAQLTVGADMRVQGHAHIFAAGDVAGQRMVVHHAHLEAGIAAENAARESQRQWAKHSNLQVVFSDPEFAYAGLLPEQAAQQGIELVSAATESRDVGKLHLEGDDAGFGEFHADARNGRLLGAGLLCRGAAEVIHLPAYAIDHEHTVHDLAGAEYYHPTKSEIVSDIGDALCRKLGGTPLCRSLD